MIAKLIEWLFGRRPAATPQAASDAVVSARQIFFYWDGKSQRTADPIVLFRGLLIHPDFNREKDFGLLESGDDVLCTEAMERISHVVRDVFGIPLFDDGGLTVAECLGLLTGFYAWCESQKKSGSGQQTSPQNTESPSSGMQSSRGTASSGSTSISAENTCGAAPQTCLQSAP